MTKFSEFDIWIQLRCIIVVTIMQFLNWHTHGAAVNLNPVCKTDECQKLGKTLLGSMNKNVSACSNFYEHVCGQWHIHNPRPEMYDVWTMDRATEHEELKKVKKLLESVEKSTPNNENLKDLYRACMKLPHLDKSPTDAISKIMTIVGHWPIFLPKNKDITVPWSVIDNEYIKRTGESAIFDLYLVLVTGKLNKYIMPELKPLFSPYGTIVRSHGWGRLSGHKNHYKNSLYKIIASVAPPNITYSISNMEKDVNDVINFREELREIIGKLPPENSNSITITEFQKLYDQKVSKNDWAKIDWSQKIGDIYKSYADSRFHFDPDETAMFVDKTYFLMLASLLKKTSIRTIANHIHLYFAERHLILSSDMLHEIRQSYGNEISTKSGIRRDPPRWEWCIKQHNLQGTMRNMYVEAFFPPTRKAEIEKLFVETKHLIKQQIFESTWLDNNMIEKSMEKINNMKSVIGYSVLNTSDGNSQSMLDPLKSDVHYLRSENAVCATAVSLQSRLYELNVPYVIQYGATVAVFGHEVYHAFDRATLKYDCYGENWWSNEMRKKLKHRMECFELQYENKREEELHNHGIKNWGILPDTSSEDIADVMGAKAAYKGYKQTFDKLKGTCEVLPGFENTSCDQLFFIVFAHSLCSHNSDVGTLRQLLTDEHNISRVRVNGVALNMEEFGTAFGCQSTDPLRKAKRCDIWKN